MKLSKIKDLFIFYGLLYPALDAHRMGPHFGQRIFTKLGYLTTF